MALKIETDILYGNACDITVLEREDVIEISFAPAPHGGPECLWFCFRLAEVGHEPPCQTIRLALKHPHNMLGGHTPSSMHPVIKDIQGDWQRLGPGTVTDLPDGRAVVTWEIEAPQFPINTAYCYPYGRSDVETLIRETDGYWRMDTIGVSQEGRPLIRLSNDYGKPQGDHPGLYLLARQHAGETPGSWVLDGFLRHIATLGDRAPLVWAVPLTNIDGIENGDYGKDNFPYDLNRAWGRPPMRHEVLVMQTDMQRWAQRCHPVLAIDFHAPGACETSGIYAYVPDPERDQAHSQAVLPWAKVAETALTSTYAAESFSRVAHYPSRWETPRFTTYGWYALGVPTITFETPYALVREHVMTREDYRDAGRRIATGMVATLVGV